MAITVVSPGQVTRVAAVKVGRPVRRVTATQGAVNRLEDVDISNLTNGSVLVYKTSTAKWTSTIDLEDQNLNGGQF